MRSSAAIPPPPNRRPGISNPRPPTKHPRPRVPSNGGLSHVTSPTHDVAHLSYVELFTPEPERALWFFTEILGLTENGSKGNSVYLRTWDDYEQFTLKPTAHHTSGIGPTGLRAESEEALERRVKAIEASELGLGWQDGEPGLEATYAFRDPDGHLMHVYYQSDWYSAPPRAGPGVEEPGPAVRADRVLGAPAGPREPPRS
jgi:catechol 2,3-dioxygenase